MERIAGKKLIGIRLCVFLILLTVNACSGVNDSTQPLAVTLEELFNHPRRYNGRDICTSGVYLRAFEVSALAQSSYEQDGITHISQPNIWVEGGDFRQKKDCFPGEHWPESLFCQVEICGNFQIAKAALSWKTAGERNWVEVGFGHMSTWPYQISNLKLPIKQPTNPPLLTAEPVNPIYP